MPIQSPIPLLTSITKKPANESYKRGTINFGTTYSGADGSVINVPQVDTILGFLYAFKGNLSNNPTNFDRIRSLFFSWQIQTIVSVTAWPRLIIQATDTFQTYVITPNSSDNNNSAYNNAASIVIGALQIETNSSNLNFYLESNANTKGELSVNVNNFDIDPFVYSSKVIAKI